MSDARILDHRRETMGRLVCYGSLVLAVAISLTFAAGEITRTVTHRDWLGLPIYGNAALAAAGVAFGTVYGRGLPGRRIVTALVAAAAGVACYAGLFFIGLISVITVWNSLRG